MEFETKSPNPKKGGQMNKYFFITILIFLTFSIFCQNNAPVASNISVAQRTDGSKIIDIYYDVTDADGDSLTITLYISSDDGVNWDITPTQLSGDIGAGILSGTGKHILWNAGDEATGYEGSQFKFKVIANDGQEGFEWCYVPEGIFTYGEFDEIQLIPYDFQIMKYEVTNSQYVTFLEEALANGDITVTTSTVEGYYTGDENYSAGSYLFLDLVDSDCRIDWTGTEFTIVSGYEDHPVVEITWFGSWAFADFYGFDLPTEFEWEKAAHGNTGYDYPWGNSIDGSMANYFDSGDPWEPGTTPIGMYNGQIIQDFQTADSPSPFGGYDMVGNLWELTDSFWGGGFTARVKRGGCWLNDILNLKTWIRANPDPHQSESDTGFRCIRIIDNGFAWCNIPAGEYTYGEGDTIKTIDYNYNIMKYEVTNLQYKRYLEDALADGEITVNGSDVEGFYTGDENYPAGTYPFYSLGTPIGNNYARISATTDTAFVINVPAGYNPGDFDNHPVVYVTWFGAWHFAEHYGLRLPTEFEWEKAARGDTGYDYPWGDTITGNNANYVNSGDPWDNGTTPVGYYNGYNGTIDSPSPYGVYDMCGNVNDWTDSWFGTTNRFIRGGAWNGHSYDDDLCSWYRNTHYNPTYNYCIIGFRCAKDSE